MCGLRAGKTVIRLHEAFRQQRRRGTCRVCLRRRQREHQIAPMETKHTNEAVEVGEEALPKTKPKRKRKRRRRKTGPSDVIQVLRSEAPNKYRQSVRLTNELLRLKGHLSIGHQS